MADDPRALLFAGNMALALFPIHQLPLGCVWIPNLVREKKMKMEKLDGPSVWDHWIIYLFHFYFILLHQILDPSTTLSLTFEPDVLITMVVVYG